MHSQTSSQKLRVCRGCIEFYRAVSIYSLKTIMHRIHIEVTILLKALWTYDPYFFSSIVDMKRSVCNTKHLVDLRLRNAWIGDSPESTGSHGFFEAPISFYRRDSSNLDKSIEIIGVQSRFVVVGEETQGLRSGWATDVWSFGAKEAQTSLRILAVWVESNM